MAFDSSRWSSAPGTVAASQRPTPAVPPSPGHRCHTDTGTAITSSAYPSGSTNASVSSSQPSMLSGHALAHRPQQGLTHSAVEHGGVWRREQRPHGRDEHRAAPPRADPRPLPTNSASAGRPRSAASTSRRWPRPCPRGRDRSAPYGATDRPRRLATARPRSSARWPGRTGRRRNAVVRSGRPDGRRVTRCHRRSRRGGRSGRSWRSRCAEADEPQPTLAARPRHQRGSSPVPACRGVARGSRRGRRTRRGRTRRRTCG